MNYSYLNANITLVRNKSLCDKKGTLSSPNAAYQIELLKLLSKPCLLSEGNLEKPSYM
jgi:hypothetical protein